MGRSIEEGGKGTRLPEDIGVLIVEETKFQSDILRNALAGAGVATENIVVQRDIASAIETLKNISPDIVFTEWELPDASGEFLVQTIRERGMRVPILVVTGHGDTERVREALSAGVSDYILKPVSNETITKRVARHLRRAGLDPVSKGAERSVDAFRS